MDANIHRSGAKVCLKRLSDNVFAYNPKADPNGAFAGQTFYEWLPNFGVRQDLTKEWSLNAAFGTKVIARPDWGPQASNFNSNEAAFLAHGMNLVICWKAR